MSIEFTQYVAPRGERRFTEIDRSADIQAMADRFIESGGRFESEVLSDSSRTVSLTAVHEVDGEEQDIAIVLSRNGPDIPAKVDELVRRAIAWLEADRKAAAQ